MYNAVDAEIETIECRLFTDLKVDRGINRTVDGDSFASVLEFKKRVYLVTQSMHDCCALPLRLGAFRNAVFNVSTSSGVAFAREPQPHPSPSLDKSDALIGDPVFSPAFVNAGPTKSDPLADLHSRIRIRASSTIHSFPYKGSRIKWGTGYCTTETTASRS